MKTETPGQAITVKQAWKRDADGNKKMAGTRTPGKVLVTEALDDTTFAHKDTIAAHSWTELRNNKLTVCCQFEPSTHSFDCFAAHFVHTLAVALLGSCRRLVPCPF